MADFFTPEQIAHLSATTVRCALLFRFDFATAPAYAWTGDTMLSVGGNDYLPLHGAVQVDGLGFSGEPVSNVITLSVQGLPDQDMDFLSTVTSGSDEADQRLLTISLQLFDADWQTVGSPIPLMLGLMQRPKVARGEMAGFVGAVQSVTLTAENVFYNRSRPAHGRYTDRDQQARSDGDRFFGFVSGLLGKTITYPDF